MSCGNCGGNCKGGCERVVITKRGERGLQGPPGPQGEQGIQGAAGQNGTNGTDGIGNGWTSGDGAPVTAGNTSGDQYLNTDNGDVYQWDGAAWNLTGNIEGPQGAQGDPGDSGILPVSNVDPSAVAIFTFGEDQNALNKTIVFDEVVLPDPPPTAILFETQLSPSLGDIIDVVNIEGNADLNFQPNTANTTIGVWTPGGYVEAVGTGQVVSFDTGTGATKGLSVTMKCVSVNGADILWIITNHNWNGVDPVIV